MSICFQLVLELKNIVLSEIGGIHFWPASRSGLYQILNSFGGIIAELAKKRPLVRSKILLPDIPEHVSDYFIGLTTIKDTEIIQDSRFEYVARSIEDRLLQGRVFLDSRNNAIRYNPVKTDLVIGMSAASSMVAELSPMVTAIRYNLAQHGEIEKRSGRALVFVEEPESHLHPELQAEFMAIITQLREAGVKLIITTHSNYIFDATNNLILAGKLNRENFSATLLKLTDKGSIGQPVSTNKLGMEDLNFLPVAEMIFENKMAIMDRFNGSF